MAAHEGGTVFIPGEGSVAAKLTMCPRVVAACGGEDGAEGFVVAVMHCL
jgi:hypothetical protein